MSSLFKNSVFYLNILLLLLVILLAGQSNLWQKAQAAVNYITSTTGGTINYLVSFVGAANPTYQVGSSIIYDSGQGKIGIGTVSPGAQLDVNGIAITGGQTLSLGGGSNLANEKLRLFYDSTNNTNYLAGKTGTSLQLGSGNDNVLLLQEGTIIYNALAKLKVADYFTASIGAADLRLGHSSRRGTPGIALTDWGSRLIINYARDWPQGVEVRSNLYVQDTAYANGQALCQKDGTNCPAGGGAWGDYCVNQWRSCTANCPDPREYILGSPTTFYGTETCYQTGRYLNAGGTSMCVPIMVPDQPTCGTRTCSVLCEPPIIGPHGN